MDNKSNFHAFLKGSLQRPSNQSLVKYLPEDILYKIWLEYAIQTHTLSELIEKEIVDCVKYGLSQGMTYSEDVVCHNLELVKWLYDQGKRISLLSGVRSKNLEVVQFILNKEDFKASDDGVLLENVAKENRNVSVYEFIFQKYYFGAHDYLGVYATNSLKSAIIGENYDVMKWILLNNCDKIFTEEHLCLLLERGNVEAVEWVKNTNFLPLDCESRVHVLLHCVKSGNIELLKLLENEEVMMSQSCDINVCEYAISNGMFEIFVWLHRKYNFKCTYALLRMSTNSKRNCDLSSYIFSNRALCYTFDEAIMWSCAYDDLHTIRFLLEEVDNTIETHRQVVRDATRWAGLNVLEYMYCNFRHIFDRSLVIQSLVDARKNFITSDKTIEFMEKIKV